MSAVSPAIHARPPFSAMETYLVLVACLPRGQGIVSMHPGDLHSFTEGLFLEDAEVSAT